jgi:hypothetical protein
MGAGKREREKNENLIKILIRSLKYVLGESCKKSFTTIEGIFSMQFQQRKEFHD